MFFTYLQQVGINQVDIVKYFSGMGVFMGKSNFYKIRTWEENSFDNMWNILFKVNLLKFEEWNHEGNGLEKLFNKTVVFQWVVIVGKSKIVQRNMNKTSQMNVDYPSQIFNLL